MKPCGVTAPFSRALCLAVLAAAGLGACAPLTPPAAAPPTATPAAFHVYAQVTATRKGKDGGAVGGKKRFYVLWRRQQNADNMQIRGPFGATLAQIVRAANGQTTLTTATGKTQTASNAGELAKKALGFALPVEALAHWLHARPAPGAPAKTRRNANGRAEVIAQNIAGQQWQAQYTQWRGGLPAVIQLQSQTAEAKIVVEQWLP